MCSMFIYTVLPDRFVKCKQNERTKLSDFSVQYNYRVYQEYCNADPPCGELLALKV